MTNPRCARILKAFWRRPAPTNCRRGKRQFLLAIIGFSTNERSFFFLKKTVKARWCLTFGKEQREPPGRPAPGFSPAKRTRSFFSHEPLLSNSVASPPLLVP